MGARYVDVVDFWLTDLAYLFSVAPDSHLYYPNVRVLVKNVSKSQLECTEYINSCLLGRRLIWLVQAEI